MIHWEALEWVWWDLLLLLLLCPVQLYAVSDVAQWTVETISPGLLLNFERTLTEQNGEKLLRLCCMSAVCC